MKHLMHVLAMSAAFSLAALPALSAERETKSRNSGDTTTTGTTETAPDPDKASLKALLEDGFEIKSIVLIPRAIVTGGGSTIDVDAVMIVVTRGPELANCYVTFAGFADGTYYNGTTPICTILK
jgi:hypothetical protein